MSITPFVSRPLASLTSDCAFAQSRLSTKQMIR